MWVLAIGLPVVAFNECEFSVGWVFSFLFGMEVVAGARLGDGFFGWVSVGVDFLVALLF